MPYKAGNAPYAVASCRTSNAVHVSPSTRFPIWEFYAVGTFLGIIFSQWYAFEHSYSATKYLLAPLLLSLYCYPTVRYWAKQEMGLPAFPLFCLSYALYFAIPIFTREPTIELVGEQASLSDDDINAALLMSILGALTLFAGYYGFRTAKLTKILPAISLPIDPRKAIVFCLLMSSLSFSTEIDAILQEKVPVLGMGVVRVILNQAIIAIAILSGLIYSGWGHLWHRIFLWVFTLAGTLKGLSIGFLEQSYVYLAAVLMMRWNYIRKIPVAVISTVLFLIIFLTPVKQHYREVVLYNSVAPPQDINTIYEKAFFWIVLAWDHWGETLSGEQTFKDSAAPTASRLDMIHQFAHVYSMTPSVVPHQWGRTYSYFAVAFIPRILWPDKPEAGDANYFFAVSYRITTEEGARRSTFGMSLLAESFINFGWAGITLIMLLQGALLGLLQHTVGESVSGLGGQSLYISLVVFLLNGVGSSAEIMFGNIIQCLLLGVAFLWWVRDKNKVPSLKQALSFD